MANQFASDKKYLELEGLKALIIKIGAMREEYVTQNQEFASLLAKLTLRLDALIPDAGDGANDMENIAGGSYDYTEGTILECVAKYIQDIRNELGASDTILEDPDGNIVPIYARLDQLEAYANDLLARTEKLEQESFAKVICSNAEEVKTTNLWKAQFFPAGTILPNDYKVNTGSEDIKPLGEIALNTSDFVVDGILDAVRLIAIVEPGNKIADLSNDGNEYISNTGEGAEEPWKTLIGESGGKEVGSRYIVFSFKTINQDAEDIVDPDKNPDTPTDKPLSNIWVSMHDLHDSFEFEGKVDEGREAGKDNEYATLEVTDQHTTTGSTHVTYTLKFTADFVLAIDKLLGKVEGTRSYDAVNTELTDAQANIKELQDYVRDGGFEETIDNEDGSKTTVTREGLLKRTADLEDRATDLEKEVDAIDRWVDGEGIISEAFVNRYFDAVVFASEGEGADERKALYEELKDTVIDKPFTGKLDEIATN